jgi:hypothetical protein
MPRPFLALWLAALLFAHPAIASAWAAAKQAESLSSALCLTSEPTTPDHEPMAGEGHCCILCERVTMATPDLAGHLIPIAARLADAEHRYACTQAATGPPSIDGSPQQSRAPPCLT